MTHPTIYRKKLPSQGHVIKIDSALKQVAEITAEMRHQVNSSGGHNLHTAALKQACALLEPPIDWYTFYSTGYCAVSIALVGRGIGSAI